MPWTVALVTDHRSIAFYGADTSGGQITAGRLESGGDIQATTKIVDCRSLKSSPPCVLETCALETSILESDVLEGSAFSKCRVFPSDPEITVTVVPRTR